MRGRQFVSPVLVRNGTATVLRHIRRPATCGWSKSERTTEMPSTIEVRSLASSATQSFRYHRSIASTCSLSLPSVPCSLSSVSYRVSSSSSRSRNPVSSRHVAVCALGTGFQAQSSRASVCVARSLLATAARTGQSWAASYRASRIFRANSFRVDRAAVDVPECEPPGRSRCGSMIQRSHGLS